MAPVYRVRTLPVSACLADLLGGQVQMAFATASSAMPFLKSGRLRALGVSSAQPSPLAPGITPIAASGLPGYESISISGEFVPAATPAAIVQRLNAEILRFLHTLQAKEKFFSVGVEAVGTTPEQLTAAMTAEMSRMGKVIRDAGIRED
jgi:tripartite-type tricarboxylate transporter receptor subunit TctC